MSQGIGALDTAIVVLYFLATISFGLWAGRRKVGTGEGLFLADREATWPMVGASLFSANISSQQFVGQCGLAYSIGLVAGAFQLVGAMCFLLLAMFFVDVYLGLNLRTAPEFFERRYSAGPRLFVSGINIVMIIAANLVTALYAGATVITDLLGWTGPGWFTVGVVVIAGAAGLYTVFGGLRAVLWVDLLQAALLVCGGAMVFVVALKSAGGFDALLHPADAVEAARWSVVRPWSESFGWLPLLTGAVILGVHGHCTDHDYVQRALAARSVYHSKMGALFAAFLKMLALFIVAAPGVLAAKLLPGLSHPDQAYTRLVTEFVPPGLTGLVMAGLLAAILGTVAAGLSASSAMVVFDFVGRLRPNMTDHGRVRLGRLVMIGVLVISALLAPSIRQYQGLFGYLVRVWSLLAPPVFVCVVFGIFSKRATSRGAVVALSLGCVLGGVAFWLLARPDLLKSLPIYLHNPLNISFVIMLVCASAMWSLRATEPVPQVAGGQFERRRRESGLTPREQTIYRVTLGAMATLLVAIVLTFSPWGLAR